MYMRDQHSDIKVTPAIVPATLSADTEGIVIDTSTFHSLEFLFNVAAGLDASNYFTVQLFEGELVSGSAPTFAQLTQVSNDDILNPGEVINAAGSYKVGYVGYSRFVAVKLVETGTASAIVSANAVLGMPNRGPVE